MTNERQVLYLFIVCTLLILGYQAVIFVVTAVSWSSGSQPQPLADPAEWPLPLQDLRAAMAADGFDVASLEVYQLDPLPDEKAIVRMPNSDAALEFLTQRWELTPVGSLPPEIERELQRLPDDWQPGDLKQLQPLESRSVREQSEGDLYYVFRSVDGQQIYIRYYFDF